MYRITNIDNELHVTNKICASDFVKNIFSYVNIDYGYKLKLARTKISTCRLSSCPHIKGIFLLLADTSEVITSL